jgi:hypothetical protein
MTPEEEEEERQSLLESVRLIDAATNQILFDRVSAISFEKLKKEKLDHLTRTIVVPGINIHSIERQTLRSPVSQRYQDSLNEKIKKVLNSRLGESLDECNAFYAAKRNYELEVYSGLFLVNIGIIIGILICKIYIIKRV